MYSSILLLQYIHALTYVENQLEYSVLDIFNFTTEFKQTSTCTHSISPKIGQQSIAGSS